MATKKTVANSSKTATAKKTGSAGKGTATAKKGADTATAKRAPNAAFMKPVTPSAVLAAVIGEAPLPRTEVTKKIWDYIKQNGLQDENNRRMLNADEKLKPVFGGKEQVSMFEMTKLVSAQLK